jgi:hypothetical protein
MIALACACVFEDSHAHALMAAVAGSWCMMLQQGREVLTCFLLCVCLCVHDLIAGSSLRARSSLISWIQHMCAVPCVQMQCLVLCVCICCAGVCAYDGMQRPEPGSQGGELLSCRVLMGQHARSSAATEWHGATFLVLNYQIVISSRHGSNMAASEQCVLIWHGTSDLEQILVVVWGQGKQTPCARPVG